MSKKSVGLIVLVETPEKGLAAILNRRRAYDDEEKRPESWPGGCQVTTHGGLEGEETFEAALIREAAEELGPAAQTLIFAHASDLVEVAHLAKDDKEVITYAIKMNPGFAYVIRRGRQNYDARLVFLSDLGRIQDLSSFSKATGVSNPDVIAMFPDEKDALVKAFELFS